MAGIFRAFLSFDTLIGPNLVRLVYYLAAAMIACVSLGGVLVGVFALVGGNVVTGLVQMIAAPLVGAVALVYWRFVCELFMLAFQANDRLGEVRDLMRRATGAPDPNHPEF